MIQRTDITTLIFFNVIRGLSVFSWVNKCKISFFVFPILPFGITSTLFVFTKVVRPWVKYWRFNSLKITYLLNDGIGIEYNYEQAKCKLEFLLDRLTKSGLLPNNERSTWVPCKTFNWLDIDMNRLSESLKNTRSLIEIVLNRIDFIWRKIFASAMILVKLTCWITYLNKIRKKQYFAPQISISLQIYRAKLLLRRNF